MITNEEVRELMPKLHRYARDRCYTYDYNAAEDLIQDTLLRAIASKYNPEKGPLISWLKTIMKNISIDKNISRKTETQSLSELAVLSFTDHSQDHIVALKQSSSLPNFDLALKKALGYSFDELVDETTKKTSCFKWVNKFYELKEDYV